MRALSQNYAAYNLLLFTRIHTAGVGALLQICGLGSTERHAFMSVLMHYGPPFIHSKPELGWQPYEQHLRNKTKKEVRRWHDQGREPPHMAYWIMSCVFSGSVVVLRSPPVVATKDKHQ